MVLRRSDRCPRLRSYPAKQDQDQKNDNHKAQPAAAIVSGAIERTPSKAPETSEQDDDQNYEKYDADRQSVVSLFNQTDALCDEKLRLKAQASHQSVSERKAPAE
jgi:hypothetical protein